MTAAEFLMLLEAGDNAAMRGQIVTGGVNLNGMRVRTPVFLQEIDFEGEANFADAAFDHSLSFVSCSFAQGLSLSSARIKGQLLFESVQFFGWSHRFMEAVFQLDGAQIEGNVELTRTVVDAPVTAHGIRVGGDFRVMGCDFRKLMTLSGASIGGDLRFIPWFPSLKDDELTATWATRTQVFEYLDLTAAKIQGLLLLEGVRVGGGVVLTGAKVDVGVHSQRSNPDRFGTEIGGNWEMSAAVVGFLQVSGTLIDGSFRANLLKCGSVTLGRGEWSNQPCRMGGLFGLAMEIGWLSLGGIQITGTKQERGHRGICIEDSEIKGQLAFWQPNQQNAKMHRRSGFAAGALVIGDVVIHNCRIAGNCVLTNLRATGAVSFNNSTLAGGFCFRSTLPAQVPPNEMVELRANATQLELENVHCAGDIDLSGLELQPPSDAAAPSSVLSINAKDLACRGRLILWSAKKPMTRQSEKISAQAGAGHATEIPGKADFSGASASKFVISGRSFLRTITPSDDDQLILTGATFREMEVPEGTSTCPVRINLADLSVKNWTMEGQSDPKVETLTTLLERDRVRRDSYRAIETYYRDRGDDHAANKLLVAMHHRISLEKGKQGVFHWLGQKLFVRPVYGRLLGYGTSPKKLGLIILLVWLFALPIYFAPENFEPSLASQSVLVHTERETLHKPPPDSDWRVLRPLLVSLRYHIPGVALGAEGDWSLRSSGPLDYDLVLLPKLCLPVAPESVGSILLLLNWVMWPPYLAFLLRKAFRNA